MICDGSTTLPSDGPLLRPQDLGTRLSQIWFRYIHICISDSEKLALRVFLLLVARNSHAMKFGYDGLTTYFDHPEYLC